MIKKNKYHSDRTVPKSNRKCVETGTNDTPNTHVHDSVFPGLDIGTAREK
jgi:hypothetical protein